MEAWNAVRQRTVENATMLCAFTENPEAPKGNRITVPHGNWTLSVEHERQLAEDLAFISSYRDCSDEIMAVCLEEGVDRRSLLVRVASNKGNLQRVVDNLQAVADVMVEAVPRSTFKQQ